MTYELVVVKDESTWPRACNVGYQSTSAEIVLFTADDLEALPGWAEAAIEFLFEKDELPAPKVYNHIPTEENWDNPEDGPDGAITDFTRIPIMRRDQYERIGPWPEIIYYADLWVSYKGRSIGIETRMLYSYRFIHHWSGVGRVDSRENLDEAGRQLAKLKEEM